MSATITSIALIVEGLTQASLTEEHKSNRKLSAGDLQNGEFVYEWPDGRRYEGSWKDGKVRFIHFACPDDVRCYGVLC